MNPIRVTIAEDNPSVRAAVAELLAADRGIDVVGLAADATEAISLAEEVLPDVALLDVRMPNGGGVRAAHDIRRVSPLTRILAFSVYDDRETVLAMLRAGAHGYLLKGSSGEEILRAIREAVTRGSALSAGVAGTLVGALSGHLQRSEEEAQRQARLLERIEAVLGAPQSSIEMVYQPVVGLATGRVVGAEALSRFQPQPIEPPDVWFTNALEVGRRVDLELAAVAMQVADVVAIPPSTFLAVNLSPDTVTSGRLAEVVAKVPAGQLVIEITEHAPVADYAGLSAALEELRAGGARLAVDDAGAGYASLRHILLLSPDYIKLDVSLTRSIEADPARRALAVALIGFAGETGATIIAEGIETRDQLSTLLALGVGLGQGFFLAKPGPLPVPTRITAYADDSL
jgi:EAL domain-containing protein (putative c-di-GMP-specific phosphodiesterase class I)/CheY-like chemotaxis protein